MADTTLPSTSLHSTTHDRLTHDIAGKLWNP